MPPAPFLSLWKYVKALKPSILTNSPHYNFMSMHCMLAVLTLLRPLELNISHRLMDYFPWYPWFDMCIPQWQNQIHRRSFPRLRRRHSKRSQHGESQRVNYMATTGLLFWSNAGKPYHHQLLCRDTSIILV